MTTVENNLQSTNSASSPTLVMESQTKSLDPNPPESIALDSSKNSVPEKEIVPTSNTTTRKPRPLRSKVWLHFEKVTVGGVEKAKCLHCGQLLTTGRNNGTSHLKDHIDNRCSKRYGKGDSSQKLLNFNRHGNGTARLENHNFDQEVSRKELASMVIMHEYPLSMVDHIGFKRYTASLNPNFKLISRNTLKSDIMKMFQSETANLRKTFEDHGGRLAITTDMWTSSHQKKGYMAVTTHYIDKKWKLIDKIVRFVYVPAPHTAEPLAEAVLNSLYMFNIHEKLSCVVVDKCFTNDKMLENISKRFDSTQMMLGGYFLKVRCSAQVWNLVVQDGLDVIASRIEKIRNSVSFWTAIPKRIQMFEDKARILKIDVTKKLALDVETRWNSTYLMLQTAIPYKEVFARLKTQHPKLKFEVPTENEWKWGANICEKLSNFHKVIELFSGRSYPTANLFFRKIFQIKIALQSWLKSDDLIIVRMAKKMVLKFDKYWSSINGILAVAAVLDPRDKMESIEFYFKNIYGDTAETEVEVVKSVLISLLTEYQEDSSVLQNQAYVSHTSDVLGKRRVNSDEEEDEFCTAKKNRKKKISVRSELDFYLDEPALPESDDFDVLTYWKCDLKYPTLCRIAKDVLSIPVSTVASESAFSMGGRVVSPHRASLHVDTVEALMCLQSWIGGDFAALALDDPKFAQTLTILEDVDVDVKGTCDVMDLKVDDDALNI